MFATVIWSTGEYCWLPTLLRMNVTAGASPLLRRRLPDEERAEGHRETGSDDKMTRRMAPRRESFPTVWGFFGLERIWESA